MPLMNCEWDWHVLMYMNVEECTLISLSPNQSIWSGRISKFSVRGKMGWWRFGECYVETLWGSNNTEIHWDSFQLTRFWCEFSVNTIIELLWLVSPRLVNLSRAYMRNGLMILTTKVTVKWKRNFQNELNNKKNLFKIEIQLKNETAS